MRKLILLSSLAVITALSACSGGGVSEGDAVVLKLQPKKGENYLTNMDMDMSMQIGEQKVNSLSKFVMNSEIQDVSEEGNVEMEYRFKKIRMEMNTPQGKMVIDPDEESATMPGMEESIGAFKVMKNMGLKTTMTNKGELLNLEVLSDSIDAMMLAQVKQTFESNMAKNFKIYPDEPVKIGDSWEIVIDQNMNGLMMKATNNYTLKQILNGKAILEVKTDLTASGEGMEGMEMTGTATGEITVFLDSGMIADGLQTMEIGMTSPMGSISLRATVTMKTEKS